MQRGRLLAVVVMAVALWLTLWAPAASSETRTWERTGFTQFATRLFTPRSGALFAVKSASADGRQFRRETGDVYRSDDGGLNWHQVRRPAPDHEPDYIVKMVIDPQTHPVAYAWFSQSLYKTDDDAVTWHPIDQLREGFSVVSTILAVSAADHQIVYAVAEGNLTPDSEPGWWIRRSDDGGATWHDGDAYFGRRAQQQRVSELYPSATDPDRALRAIGGGSDGRIGHRLELSVDRGVTWTTVIPESGPDATFPDYFATGLEGTIYVVGYRATDFRGS